MLSAISPVLSSKPAQSLPKALRFAKQGEPESVKTTNQATCTTLMGRVSSLTHYIYVNSRYFASVCLSPVDAQQYNLKPNQTFQIAKSIYSALNIGKAVPVVVTAKKRLFGAAKFMAQLDEKRILDEAFDKNCKPKEPKK